VDTYTIEGQSPTTKRCSKCDTLWPLTEFRYVKSRSRHRSFCRYCERDYKLNKRYNLGSDGWEELLESQDWGCAVCGSSQKLVVDHDHQTNYVRGILCDDCNVGLGRFKDDPLIISKVLEYLEHSVWAQSLMKEEEIGSLEAVTKNSYRPYED